MKAALPITTTLLSLLLLTTSCHSQTPPTWGSLIQPDNSGYFTLVQHDQPMAHFALGGWGPNWGWVGLDVKGRATNGVLDTTFPFTVDANSGKVITVRMQARKSSDRELTYRFDLNAKTDVPLTMLMLALNGTDKGNLKPKNIILIGEDGKTNVLNYPFGRHEPVPDVRKVTLLEGDQQITVTCNPPLPIGFDGDARIQLAHDLFPAGSRTITLTFSFPEPVALLADDKAIADRTILVPQPDWYPFQSSNTVTKSVTGMEDWLDKPAGKHGGTRMVGDHFAFTDGTSIKFWGVNLAYGNNCAPDKGNAVATAAKFAHFGINAVRLHKFTYATDANGIGDLNDATKMDPAGLDRLDYFAAQLKQQGVYFGWSHTYGFHPRPANRSRLLAYDEIQNGLQGNTYALINFAPDVQDLMIEMVVNLLKHKNPYTGLTYADEPALSYLEIQNEDDIFFWTTSSILDKCPTYKKFVATQFADWLRAKYGTQAALSTAWNGSLQNGESLDAGHIEPNLNIWFYTSDHLPSTTGGERARLLDTAMFLHSLQDRYYEKFTKAVRAAGYKGPICGSPWQAPGMLPHYDNLLSDYEAGWIDRHNYFEGGVNGSMLAAPGSGYFSSGLQQVKDRPFGLSEWIHVYPDLYSVEGPIIVGAYGMGLQGWSSSYEFQSDASPRLFDDTLGTFPWGVWDANTPTQLGVYPAVSRLVLRGDVKVAPIIGNRTVTREQLAQGQFPFSDTLQQTGDVKSFGGTVPAEALAAGRVLVSFTDKPALPVLPDMSKYSDGTAIVSTTKQLRWDKSGKGFLTIDTDGTKGVVGFTEGKTIALDGLKITCKTPYAAIMLTALHPKETLTTAPSALLTVIARASNSGFTYFSLDEKVIDNGKGPVLMEPVSAMIHSTGRPIMAVYLLDHDGHRTNQQVPFKDGAFTIDGTRDKTPYYEVVFAPTLAQTPAKLRTSGSRTSNRNTR